MEILLKKGVVCIPPLFVLKWARIGEKKSIRGSGYQSFDTLTLKKEVRHGKGKGAFGILAGII
jgi:hypothetical protein